MINKVKNYFAGLNRQKAIIGSILVITFGIAGVSASGLSLLGAGAMFMFAGTLFYKKFNVDGSGFNIDKRILIPAALLIIISGAYVFLAQNHYLAFRAFLTMIVLFAVIVSAKNISKSQITVGVASVSVVTFLYALYEYFNTTSLSVIRLEGFAGYANTFGLYVAIFGLVALYHASLTPRVRVKWFMIVIAAMNFFVAFMTLSRGVLLAVIISAIISGLLFYKKINFKKVVKYTGMVIAITAVIVFVITTIKKQTTSGNVVLLRTDSTLGQASGTRLEHFQTAVRMFGDHKFGVGSGNYPHKSFDYEIRPIDNAIDPHSFIMTLLAEYGVFIVIWLYLLFEIIRSLVINRNNFDSERVFYLFVSLAFFLHICVDSDMRQPFSWLVFAILLGKLLNFNSSFKFKQINIIKNVFSVVLLIPAMTMLFAGALLINFYDTSGTYAELEVRDKYVLFAANLNQIQSDVWENSAKMALAKATVAPDQQAVEISVNELFYRTDRAMAIVGPQARLYSQKARGYVILRQEENYKQALEKSVSLSKYHSYNERAALAGYYVYAKDYTKLKELVLSTYDMNKAYFGSAYAAADPEKTKKYTAMVGMLEALKAQSKINKDQDIYLLTSKILDELNPIVSTL